MKKLLTIILMISLVIFISGMAYAKNASTKTDSSPKGLYGKCVSDNADLKKVCFTVTKESLSVCKSNAKEAGNKEAGKQCKKEHKTVKKQCKMTFEGSKEQCKN